MRRRMAVAGESSHALLRIAAGSFFTLHGAQKLFGMFGGVQGSPTGTVELFSLMGLAGALELVGGMLVVIGLFTRPVAFVLSGEMAVAYFMAHFPRGVFPIENNGEAAALYSFIFLFFAFNGTGRYSLDAVRTRNREDLEEVARPVEERRRRAA